MEAYLETNELRKKEGYENGTRDDRRYFDERIAELYEELAGAGFSTVDDLVSYYNG